PVRCGIRCGWDPAPAYPAGCPGALAGDLVLVHDLPQPQGAALREVRRLHTVIGRRTGFWIFSVRWSSSAHLRRQATRRRHDREPARSSRHAPPATDSPTRVSAVRMVATKSKAALPGETRLATDPGAAVPANRAIPTQPA